MVGTVLVIAGVIGVIVAYATTLWDDTSSH
jgi:hypothetical protein